MKADGGALVYIILAVISLIVSAVSKNKNKQDRPVTTTPRESHPEVDPKEPQTTWQKELEEIFGYGTKRPQQADEVDKQRTEKARVQQEEISPYVSQLNRYAETHKSEVNTVESSVYVDALSTDEEEYESFVLNAEDFDLRKAVVYAEVLNRKYF